MASALVHAGESKTAPAQASERAVRSQLLQARGISDRTFIADSAVAQVMVSRPDPVEEAVEVGVRRSAPCGNGLVQPDRARRAILRAALLCELNRERRARRLRPTRSNPRLQRAAQAHADDMVRRTYFRHDSLSGANFADRIMRAGYLRNAKTGWTIGENLGWGAGSAGSPRAVVDAWMKSPPHRANVLRPAYREIGIGIVHGAPISGYSNAATFAISYGRR